MKFCLLFVLVFLCVFAACDDSSYPFQFVEDTVTVQYNLNSTGTVDVTVANDCMYTVRTLVNSLEQEEGTNSVVWDLLDDREEYPGDGLYTVEVYLDGVRVDVQVLEVSRL